MAAKPRGWPSSVTLAHHRWPIHYVTPEHEQLREGDDDHNLGVCNIHTRQIYLDRTAHVDSLRNTLIHELAHAYFYHHPVAQSGTETDHEESIVCRMTEYIYELQAMGILEIKI